MKRQIIDAIQCLLEAKGTYNEETTNMLRRENFAQHKSKFTSCKDDYNFLKSVFGYINKRNENKKLMRWLMIGVVAQDILMIFRSLKAFSHRSFSLFFDVNLANVSEKNSNLLASLGHRRTVGRETLQLFALK